MFCWLRIHHSRPIQRTGDFFVLGKFQLKKFLFIQKELTTSGYRSSGTLESHYQPNTSVILSDTPDILAKNLEEEGYRVVILPQISPEHDAQKLYATLRQLDKKILIISLQNYQQ